MRRKVRWLMVAGLVTATAALTASSLASATPDRAATTHTLRFTSVETANKSFGYNFSDPDKDVRNGTVIGYDVLNGVYRPKTQTFTFDFAGSLNGGILYGRGTGNGMTGKLTGTITGGTGRYKGVRGTMRGRPTGTNGQNEKLVIGYH